MDAYTVTSVFPFRPMVQALESDGSSTLTAPFSARVLPGLSRRRRVSFLETEPKGCLYLPQISGSPSFHPYMDAEAQEF